MDWSAFLSSLGGAAFMGGLLMFLGRKWVESRIDLRFDRLKEENSAEIRERFRRESVLFDDQRQVYREAVSVIDRAHSSAQAAIEAAEMGHIGKARFFFKDVGSAVASLISLRHGHRAVMEPEIHDLVDAAEAALRQFSIEAFLPPGLPEGAAVKDSYLQDLRKTWSDLDDSFTQLLGLIQTRIGISGVGQGRTRK